MEGFLYFVVKGIPEEISPPSDCVVLFVLIAHLVKKFPAYYDTVRFLTAFTVA